MYFIFISQMTMAASPVSNPCSPVCVEERVNGLAFSNMIDHPCGLVLSYHLPLLNLLYQFALPLIFSKNRLRTAVLGHAGMAPYAVGNRVAQRSRIPQGGNMATNILSSSIPPSCLITQCATVRDTSPARAKILRGVFAFPYKKHELRRPFGATCPTQN